MSSDLKLIVVLVTTPDEEVARSMGQSLVDASLVACAQIEGPITSIYRWQNSVEKDVEWRLVLKTVQGKYQELEKRIKNEHPYDIPQIIALPVDQSSVEYSTWLVEQIK